MLIIRLGFIKLSVFVIYVVICSSSDLVLAKVLSISLGL